MNALLSHILLSVTGNEDLFSITTEDSDYSTIYTVVVDDEYYPLLIGKGGSTVKAMTSLCNFSHRNNSNNYAKRAYIHIKKKGE
jgi:predicted RNA-binding protein YlqC (UPF0109 family)